MFLNRLKSQKYVFGEKLNDQQLEVLKNQIETADAIVIGAGAGLSTAAGLTYSGERFEKYFFDFANEYGIKDMYSGGFYPFEDMETIGLGGADISISIAIWMHRVMFMQTCLIL